VHRIDPSKEWRLEQPEPLQIILLWERVPVPQRVLRLEPQRQRRLERGIQSHLLQSLPGLVRVLQSHQSQMLLGREQVIRIHRNLQEQERELQMLMWGPQLGHQRHLPQGRQMGCLLELRMAKYLFVDQTFCDRCLFYEDRVIWDLELPRTSKAYYCFCFLSANSF